MIIFGKTTLIPNDTLKGSFRKYSGCIAHATLTAHLANGLNSAAKSTGIPLVEWATGGGETGCMGIPHFLTHLHVLVTLCMCMLIFFGHWIIWVIWVDFGVLGTWGWN